MDKHITVPVQLLRSFAVDVFIAVGVPHSDADICADVLITSDIRGIESHGMSRLKMYIDRILDGRQKPVTNLTIEKQNSIHCINRWSRWYGSSYFHKSHVFGN